MIILLALLVLTNLVLVYLLAAVPYVLLKGSAKQKIALAKEACPRYDVRGPLQLERVQ